MSKVVKCGVCGKYKVTRNKSRFIRCCGVLQPINDENMVFQAELKKPKKIENLKTDSSQPQIDETENQDVVKIVDDKTDTKKQQKDDDVVIIVDDEDGDNNG